MFSEILRVLKQGFSDTVLRESVFYGFMGPCICDHNSEEVIGSIEITFDCGRLWIIWKKAMAQTLKSRHQCFQLSFKKHLFSTLSLHPFYFLALIFCWLSNSNWKFIVTLETFTKIDSLASFEYSTKVPYMKRGLDTAQ